MKSRSVFLRGLRFGMVSMSAIGCLWLAGCGGGSATFLAPESGGVAEPVAAASGDVADPADINAAAQAIAPKWIWFPEGAPQSAAPNAPRYFRRAFELVNRPPSAFLWIAADNEYDLYLNGTKLGSDGNFERPEVYEVADGLVIGRNVIAVEARNGGGPAGLIASLALVGARGQVEYVVTDAAWKSARTVAGNASKSASSAASPSAGPSWTGLDFDDTGSAWVGAFVLRDPLPGAWNHAAGLMGRVVSLDLHPATLSPNGDGFRDEIRIDVANRFAPGRTATVRVKNADGNVVAAFKDLAEPETSLTWNGLDKKGRQVPEGDYACSIEVEGSDGLLRLEKTLRVDTTTKFERAPDRVKTLFPIGIWFDGRVEGINCSPGHYNVPKDLDKARKYYEENFADIRDHNIDIVVIPNTPPAYRETLLAAADKVGVKIVLEIVELAYVDFGGRFSVRNPNMVQDEKEVLEYCRTLIEPLKKHPSLLYYQVLDEPPAELYDNFNLISRALAQLDPERPSFSCLCFEQELPRTAALDMQMIIFDRYPIRKGVKPGDYDLRSFIPLLDSLNKHAGKRPYWMVLQTFAMRDRPDGVRYPTAAEFRAMVWLSLGRNSKGIFYFLHNSFTQEEELQGLVDLELRPHPLYADVSKMSVDLKRLAPTLLAIQPSAPRVEEAEGFDVRSFTDSAGKGYAIVTNLDVLKDGAFSGRLLPAAGPAAARIRNVLTGQSLPVSSQGDRKGFELRLAPGEGCLLALE